MRFIIDAIQFLLQGVPAICTWVEEAKWS